MTSRRWVWIRRSTILLLALGSSGVASAQDADQDAQVKTPIQLFEPEAGKGLRVGGSFVLHPELTGRAGYDSNIYDVQHGGSADAIFSLQPRFLLESDFPRHRIELRGDANIVRYAKYHGEDSESGELAAKGVAELGDWINVEPELRIARGVEQRGTAGDVFLSDTPVVYTSKEARLRIYRTQHRLTPTVEGHLVQTLYQPTTFKGAPVDLSYRNVVNRDASLRLDLQLTERFQVFTQIQGNQISYQNLAAKQLNSSGYAILGGGRLAVTNLVELEAGVGYIRQNFDRGIFRPVSAINYHLVAHWTPRQSWLVTARVERTIDGSPISNVPALFRTTYQLAAQRAIGTRVLLSADTSYAREEYVSTPRTDRRFQIGLTGQYRVTPRVGLLVTANYRRQAGGLDGRSYEGVGGSLALRIVL